MQERVLSNPKIEVRFETNVTDLQGDGGVESATIVFKQGTPEEQVSTLPIDGLFLAIGHTPNSLLFRPWIKTDEAGYIITEGSGTATNVPGIFAAGDVADPFFKQAITAAASGCKAAIQAEKYLMTL